MVEGIYQGAKHIKQLFMNLTNFQALKNNVFMAMETPLDIRETIQSVIKYHSIEAGHDGVTIVYKDRNSQIEQVLADSSRINLILENVLR